MPAKKQAKKATKVTRSTSWKVAKGDVAGSSTGAGGRKAGAALVVSQSSPPAKPAAKGLLTDVRDLILTTRQTVAQGVNSALVLLYWNVGQRIRTDILKEKRAGYGEKIVNALSAQLADEFGRGFTRTNLFNMTRFVEEFPDAKIVHALSGQLSWTHFRRIIYLDDPVMNQDELP